MIIKEFYREREDRVNLYKTYSDEGFKIRKVGTNEVYDSAIDVEGAPFTYEETTEKVITYEEMVAQMEAERAERKAAREKAVAEENTETETE